MSTQYPLLSFRPCVSPITSVEVAEPDKATATSRVLAQTLQSRSQVYARFTAPSATLDSGSDSESASSDRRPSDENAMPVVKLPPTLKQLLSLRNAHPPAGPSAKALNDVFTATLGDLKSRVNAELGAGDGLLKDGGSLKSWLVITSATLLTTNTPSTMGHLYRFATRVDLNHKGKGVSLTDDVSVLEKAERVMVMREAGLKCSVLVGIPTTINSLGALREATEEPVKRHLDQVQVAHRDDSDPHETLERGKTLFDAIYSPHTEKLLAKLGRSHPDFPGFILRHAYGGILSNPPPPVTPTFPTAVTRTLTSAVAVACLRTQGRVGPQLTSHVFGLLKAGEEPEASQTPAERWISSEQGVEWVLSTVDKLCDVVNGPPGGDWADRSSKL
ncbi:hypothetical protein FRB99_002328 [Tulasnella sp. 403]|nr:hypothetical protein FRB99_002328 [Tulasnella sp. 403]